MAEIAHFYGEELTAQTHTGDATWTEISTNCSLSYTNFSTSTKYLIVASGRWGTDSTSDWVGFDCYENEGDIFDGSPALTWGYGRTVPVSGASTDMIDYFFCQSFTTKASALTGSVQLQFQTDNTSATVTADQLSLLAIDLDALGSGNYSENVDGTTDTIDGSWEDLAAITGLSSGSTYLVMGFARISNTIGTSDIDVQLIDGSANVKSFETETGKANGEIRNFGVMGVITGQTSVKIQAQAGVLWTKAGSYLIAIDTAAFANFDYEFEATGAAITSESSQELVKIGTTPSARTSADHLFLGRFNYTAGGNDARVASTVRTGAATFGSATDVLAGDLAVFGTQQWATTDAEQVTTMGVQAYAGGTGQDVFLGGVKGTGDNNPTTEYELVAVLNFEEASGETNITATAIVFPWSMTTPSVQTSLGASLNIDFSTDTVTWIGGTGGGV